MFSVCNLLLTHSSVWRVAGLKHFKWKCQAFVSWRGQTSSSCYYKGNERADFSGMLVLWFQSELWVVVQYIWKNIKPFKRAQAPFWSYCWCIFTFFPCPQPGKSNLLTPACWSRQSIKPSKPACDQQEIWHKVSPLTAPAPLKCTMQKEMEERREPHAGLCFTELCCFISHHSLGITGAAPQAFGLLTNPIQ